MKQINHLNQLVQQNDLKILLELSHSELELIKGGSYSTGYGPGTGGAYSADYDGPMPRLCTEGRTWICTPIYQ